MFRDRQRIADLEASLAYANRKLAEARTATSSARPEESGTLTRLRTDLQATKKALRQTEENLAEARTARAIAVAGAGQAVPERELRRRLFVAEQTVKRLDFDRAELIRCNDVLSRDAVDRAGNLAAPAEVTG